MLPKIIENVIPKGYQDALEEDITRRSFPWMYINDVTFKEYGDNSGFVHAAFDYGNTPSDFHPFIKPLIYSIEEASGIKINELLRIRIGFLQPRINYTGYLYNAPHVDFHMPHYTACYYVSDSDGETVVFDKTISDVGVDITEESLYNFTKDTQFTVVDSCMPKKGTAFVFSGQQFHASTNPVNFKRRLVVTINWM
jgi:hypothetical protein